MFNAGGRLWKVWTLAALAGACLQSHAQGPEPAAATPSIDKLVQCLGSDDVLQRIESQHHLTDDPGLVLRDLEGVIKSGPLGPEQRQRLLVAANSRFCAEPRAAMGIQPANMEFGQHGLLLGQILAGFPSRDVLRVNDRLVSVDGQAINDISDMQRVVFSHDPGDEVPVVLTRDGATLHLRVKLGRYQDLRQNSQLTTDMLDRAWEFRMSSYPDEDAKSRPAPIESGITEADWKTVAQPDIDDGGDPTLDPRVRMDQRRFQDAEPGATELVAAGESRGAMMPMRLVAQGGQGLQGPNFRVLPGEGQVLIGPQVQDNPRREAQRIQQQREEMIRSRMQTLRRAIDQNIATMKNLPEAQRRSLIQENTLLQMQLDQLEQMRARPVKP